MVVLLFLQLLFSDPFSQLEPTRYSALPLPQLTSPTGITSLDGRMYLACDHLEANPGIYRLWQSTQGEKVRLEVGLALHLPQEALESLSSRDGLLQTTSARTFSPYPADWQPKIRLIDMKTRSEQSLLRPPLESRCSDGSYDCGLVGAHRLSPLKWLLVTKQNIAELLVWEKIGAQWSITTALPISVEGRLAVISDFKLIDDQLVFLIRNRWMLSKAPLQEVFAPGAWRLQTVPALDLTPLKTVFRINNAGLFSEGYAEAFTFDELGRLHLVLNNRGYPFDRSPRGRDETTPFLITYSPKKP